MSNALSERWYIGTDMHVELPNVHDSITGQPMNGMTITGDLIDSEGTVLLAGIPFDYRNGSNGTYDAAVNLSTLNTLVQGDQYTLQVTGSGTIGQSTVAYRSNITRTAAVRGQ